MKTICENPTFRDRTYSNQDKTEREVFEALRLEIIVMFPIGHLDEGVCQLRLAGRALALPDLVQAFAADAATQMRMKL